VNRHWTGFSSGATFLGVGAGTAGLTLSLAQHDRETLMRTRGNLLGYGDGALVTGALALISVGFAIVPEGTGTTVLWSPFIDSDAPWFWYTSFHLGYEEYVTDVIDSPVLGGYREVIDSKAMRRIRNSEIQVVVENTTVGGALTMNMGITGRFLSQE